MRLVNFFLLSQDQKSYSERGEYKFKKNLVFHQNEILELAVKVVVNPTYGWLTASLILYGCRPIETFSLIPSSKGRGSVVNLDDNRLNNIRRTVLASPFDFVEKLNISDQISQPVFFLNYKDYDFVEVNNLMNKWNSWFKTMNSNIELSDIRDYWAKRVMSEGLSEKLAAKYMGITYKDFCIRYK